MLDLNYRYVIPDGPKDPGIRIRNAGLRIPLAGFARAPE